MSETEKKPAQAAKKAVVKENAQKQEVVAYIGPDIPGAKQYTIFNHGLPDVLKEKMKEHPFFREFIVPVKKLAQASADLEKEGSALNVLFQKAIKR